MNNNLKNFTLLYVEDEKDVTQMLSEILEDEVKELYVAYNGVEGLEVFKEKKPDIILTDIKMPKMNGLDMLRKIKELESEQSSLILSAFNEIDYLQESIDIGVDGYISKPLDIERLLKVLNKIADRLQGYSDKKELEEAKDKLYEQEKLLAEVKLHEQEKIMIQQSKMAAMGEMLNAIAHQWRQPLNIINGAMFNLTDAYKSNNLSDEYFDEMIKITNTNIQHMSSTIEDFRNFFKPAKSSKFEIKKIVHSINSIVIGQLKAHNINLFFDIKEDIILNGSKNEFQHAILNLINNSRDAIISVEDKSSLPKDLSIRIEIKKLKNKVLISVIDNGPGIKKESQKDIFKPYFTTKEEGVGTGIGLYLTQFIVQKTFKGDVYLEKSDSTKTEFIIDIPLK